MTANSPTSAATASTPWRVVVGVLRRSVRTVKRWMRSSRTTMVQSVGLAVRRWLPASLRPASATFDPMSPSVRDSGLELEPVPHVPAWLADARLSLSDFRVLAHLWSLGRGGRQVTTARASIAARCGVNRDTVWDSLKRLEQLGLVARIKSRGRKNDYVLKVPAGRKDPLASVHTPRFPLWLEWVGMTPRCFRVYCHLARRRGKNPVAFPSVHDIIHWCRMIEPMVSASLKWLEAQGHIQRHFQASGTTSYRLLVPARLPRENTANSADLAESEGDYLAETEGVGLAESKGDEGDIIKDPIRKEEGARTLAALPPELPQDVLSGIALDFGMTIEGVGKSWTQWRVRKLRYRDDVADLLLPDVIALFRLEFKEETKLGRKWRREFSARQAEAKPATITAPFEWWEHIRWLKDDEDYGFIQGCSALREAGWKRLGGAIQKRVVARLEHEGRLREAA